MVSKISFTVIIITILAFIFVALKLKYKYSATKATTDSSTLNVLMKYWSDGALTESLSNGNGTPSTCNTLLGPAYQNAVKEGSCPANVYNLHIDSKNLSDSNNGGEFNTSENKQHKSYWGYGKSLDWKLNSGKVDGVVNIQENDTGKVTIGTDKTSTGHRTNLVGGLEADKLTVRGPIQFSSADGNLMSLTDMHDNIHSQITGLEGSVHDLTNSVDDTAYKQKVHINQFNDKMAEIDNKVKDLSSTTKDSKVQFKKGMDVEESINLIGGKIQLKNDYVGDNDPYSIQKVNKGRDRNELRITLNDNRDEALTVYGDSCGSPGGCNGPGTEQHRLGVNGFSIHRSAICISDDFNRPIQETDCLNKDDLKKLKAVSHQAGYAIDGGGSTHLLFEGYHKLHNGDTFDANSNDKWDRLYVNRGWKIVVWDHGNKTGFKQQIENNDSFTPLKMDLLHKNSVSEYQAIWIGYKNELPSDFDPDAYRTLNKDLERAGLSNEQLKQHYLHNGKREGRRYNKELPADFDPNRYRSLYKDLQRAGLSNEQLKQHYIKNGKREGRRYK